MPGPGLRAQRPSYYGARTELCEPTTLRQDWTRTMTTDAFLGLALSSSKVQGMVSALGEATARRAILDCARAFARDEQLELAYTTELYLARRRGSVGA